VLGIVCDTIEGIKVRYVEDDRRGLGVGDKM
jgi:hypothetical protein